MGRNLYVSIMEKGIVSSIDIKITGGNVISVENGTKPIDILDRIDGVSKDKAVAARFNGELIDLTRNLGENGALDIVTVDSPKGMEIYWHSSAHLLAHAVKRLYPEAKLGFGPATESGFYYDIDFGIQIAFEDLEKIQSEMEKIAKENIPVVRQELNKDEAVELFTKSNESYKVEYLDELENELSIYRQGDFFDLCRGPHLPSTGWIKHFKLLNIAGAYWRGDERNPMLQRVYGVSYPQKDGLEKYLELIEEAKKRDHRKLGKELDLFSFHPEGPGFPFWHPKGMILMNEVVNYWRGVHEREGYYEIKTPVILNRELWLKSGHWKNYRENMYFTKIDDCKYAVKPMNCPGGLLFFKEKLWSYRDFPVKYAELGLVHRHEKAGVLHGLFRVRQFTQDDAHVFCLQEQAEEEVVKVIDLVLEIYSTFGFNEYTVELSTKPKKAIGSEKVWRTAEKCLENALKTRNINYEVNKGEGAFYGPKIDFHIKDCLNRTWQCGTIQVDFSMPQRFDLEYVTKTDKRKRPVMIHRAVFGSLERFIGIMIEHYGGDFPLWLAPTQIVLIPIGEKNHEYLKKIEKSLKKHKFRVITDLRNEKVGYKIREGEVNKIRYMVIAGDKEEEDAAISVRKRKEGNLGVMKLSEFIDKLVKERADKI